MKGDICISWAELRCVIFDVDGTLYAQDQLRRRMFWALLRHYSVHPWRVKEVMILQQFRKEREKNTAYTGGNLEADQYAWVADDYHYPVQQVREVVQHWMYQRPTPYLSSCRYPGVKEFFAALRSRGIAIGIYSDYPAQDKLAALELEADLIISSTDVTINRLKPHPLGLLHIAEQLGLTPQQCLFIGDRPELDGACAEAANMPFLLVDKTPRGTFTFFTDLTHQLTSCYTPYGSHLCTT